MSVVWAWDGYEVLCGVCSGGVFEGEDALDGLDRSGVVDIDTNLR
jgi:hypothetical protein